MTKLRLLDLFSGIGGFSLGLERSGAFETVAFCEIEEFPRRVLRKHWPEVPIYEDVRELSAERLAADGIAVDAICGGFPCQDISLAGEGRGLEGERSGLWFEYARLIGEIRPRYVIVENVAALLSRGLDRVLGDLAALGYDAEWHCIPASAVGAPHRRDRIWIVADADGEHGGARRSGRPDPSGAREREPFRPLQALDDALRGRYRASESEIRPGRHGALDAGWWSVEPRLGRVADGVPDRVERLRGLGNAVVPQIPELIGRAILAAEDA